MMFFSPHLGRLSRVVCPLSFVPRLAYPSSNNLLALRFPIQLVSAMSGRHLAVSIGIRIPLLEVLVWAGTALPAQ